MNKQLKRFVDITNRSGFLFQLRIEHAVESSLHDEGFRIAATEHPWIDPRTNSERFIDLVLETGITRVVIECKRPKGGTWLFLLPSAALENNPHARLTWSRNTPDAPRVIGVSNFRLSPQCYESSICIIRSEGEDERTLLERYAARLTSSVNALAFEEASLSPSPLNDGAVYIPSIVTTASLFVARVDPTRISLQDGMVDHLDFTEVSVLKFTKSLVTDLSPNALPSDIQSASKDKQRTVLVVNSQHLIEVLREVRIPSGFGSLPWHQSRL